MAGPETQTPVHKMFKSLEGGLSYQYHSSWGQVLQVIATYFEVRQYTVLDRETSR